MKLTQSSSRMRAAAVLVIVAGAVTFSAAQQAEGTAAYVLAAVAAVLFVLEVIYGVLDGPGHSDG